MRAIFSASCSFSTMPSLPGVTETPAFAGAGARRILVPHRVHRARGRPDELDVAALADFREVRVLREKTVAGMDRIHVADFRGADDAVDLEVAFRARRGADANRLVGQLDVQRINIRLRINRERPDAEFLAGADNAQRDFAAIGDQNFLKHRSSASFQLADRNYASRKLALPDAEKDLAELHRFSAFGHDFGDHAFCFRLDFVHDFHRLDNANDRFFGDLFADIHERWGFG